jgi:hypothetical protein
MMKNFRVLVPMSTMATVVRFDTLGAAKEHQQKLWGSGVFCVYLEAFDGNQWHHV